ncbi:Uncharacterised protein [Porphyromonas crevioricanis]|uniref:Uncharacterized protein n=1 Tax=Porphyromonas crevioricanis TaxID=393921 RepID=A0A2X4PFC4_9PORP|nr:hypothetical protein SAMN02745203_00998 [Porphyromonas crevioricanis]SQH72606.1 Uncharacterised protein [Porphyromonas crevioricanis]
MQSLIFGIVDLSRDYCKIRQKGSERESCSDLFLCVEYLHGSQARGQSLDNCLIGEL